MKNHFIKTSNNIIILIWATLLMSCSMQSIVVSYPHQAKNKIPENIQSVLIVSNVIDDSYTHLTKVSMQDLFIKHEFNIDTTINDIAVVDTIMNKLGGFLFESDRFDYVIPNDRFLRANNSVNDKKLPLKIVKDLCESYHTDALISIDRLKIDVASSCEFEENYIQITSSGNRIKKDVFVLNMDIIYEAMFQVYNPFEENILLKKTVKDTLSTKETSINKTSLFHNYISVQNNLIETGIAIARNYAKEIAPSREEGKRFFFARGDKKLEEAIILAQNEEWKKAVILWKVIIEKTKSKNIKSKAQYNIAVGYEMLGDLDLAIKWAFDSYNTRYRTSTENYIKLLNKRITN